MSDPQTLDPTLVKALGHPLRLRILEVISDRGEASPVALAREFGRPLATVSHHARVLRDLGCIEVVRTRQRRGAVEHFYRAVSRPFLDDDDWAQLPTVLRRGMARELFRRLFTEASRSGTEGGFDDASACIARLPLELDERGRRELSALLHTTLQRAEAIERRSRARAANGAAPTRSAGPSELAILHFRVPNPEPTATTTTRPPLP
jgi:DNA-binding transcriptional ArsR family regulator